MKLVHAALHQDPKHVQKYEHVLNHLQGEPPTHIAKREQVLRNAQKPPHRCNGQSHLGQRGCHGMRPWFSSKVPPNDSMLGG
jgi:hypothetical protein